MQQRILVTGGTGFIGSHACAALMQAGHGVTVLDNLCNSDEGVLDRLAGICGRRPDFVRADLRDRDALRTLFAAVRFDGVIHFAGLKAVGESVAEPLNYYDNNVRGTLHLLEAMRVAGVRTLVFSSSATVYGDAQRVPIAEAEPVAPINPYGRSKRMIEEVLEDLAASDAAWRIAVLRYFNPVGAHPSGRIGEFPRGVPNNLMPYIAQVAAGLRASLSIYGGDYPTPDGTGVRDYIHVMDLVEGHLAALRYLQSAAGLLTANLGTGRGYSVMDVLRTFERVSGRRVPYQIVARRPGDVAQSFADPSLARERMEFSASRGLEQMCEDAWRWQQSLGIVAPVHA